MLAEDTMAVSIALIIGRYTEVPLLLSFMVAIPLMLLFSVLAATIIKKG